MNFNQFELNPDILKAITEAGYSEATEIQRSAIPILLAGEDLKASAETGQGKTAAFLLPALQRLTKPSLLKGKGPRVIVLVPTRELAMQVATQAKKYSKYLTKVKTVCIVGGVSYRLQRRDLQRPFEILIATPGRLIDYLEQDEIDFSRVEMLILDEADRMLDLGFQEPVRRIAAALPSKRQTLLFSATLQGTVSDLANAIMRAPKEIHSAVKKHVNIEQRLHLVDDLHHKNQLLEHLLKDDALGSAVIFTSTKRHAGELADLLKERGFEASAIHGDMNQNQRTRTLAKLRSGTIRILVATDVAARGIDVRSITHVINFDLPHNVEDYVHRIGRTGRAGDSGTALSLVSQRDLPLVRRIEKYTGYEIPSVTIPGLEPKGKKKPIKTEGAPFRNKRSFRGGRKFGFKAPDARKRKG